MFVGYIFKNPTQSKSQKWKASQGWNIRMLHLTALYEMVKYLPTKGWSWQDILINIFEVPQISVYINSA